VNGRTCYEADSGGGHPLRPRGGRPAGFRRARRISLVAGFGATAPKASAGPAATTNIALNKTATPPRRRTRAPRQAPRLTAAPPRDGRARSPTRSGSRSYWAPRRGICGVTLNWEGRLRDRRSRSRCRPTNTNWTSITPPRPARRGQNLTVSGTGRYIRMNGTARPPSTATRSGVPGIRHQRRHGSGGVDISAGGPAAPPFVADQDFAGGHGHLHHQHGQHHRHHQPSPAVGLPAQPLRQLHLHDPRPDRGAPATTCGSTSPRRTGW